MTTRVQVLLVVNPCNEILTTIILNSFQHIYNTNLFQNITYYAYFFDKHYKKMVDTPFVVDHVPEKPDFELFQNFSQLTSGIPIFFKSSILMAYNLLIKNQ